MLGGRWQKGSCCFTSFAKDSSYAWSLFDAFNKSAEGDTTPETSKIVTLICSCHNFFPFFCANTFDTSLLLIVCALR